MSKPHIEKNIPSFINEKTDSLLSGGQQSKEKLDLFYEIEPAEVLRVINTKQDSLESTGNLSINSMADGQVSIGKSTNELLSIRKKKYGRVYKSYMKMSYIESFYRLFILSINFLKKTYLIKD